MKRIFAALLVLALVCAALVIVPSAEGTNMEYEIVFTEKAPVVDGTISANEYGKYPLVSWSLEDGETDGIVLTNNYVITDDPDLAIDFYATWTDDSLYLAWKVTTNYDYRIPDGLADGWMYEYCCVQFMMTPGAPDSSVKKYQTAEWSGDYLEIGLCLKDDGNSYKVCWSQPAKVSDSLMLTDWDFAGSRDGNVTTYECRLPWDKTGVDAKGDDAAFGLLWAVGAQENYDEVAHGLIEWQDGIIGGKAADKGAIMMLTGSGEGPKEVIPSVQTKEDAPAGVLPEGLEESLLQIDLLNKPVTAEKIALITDAANINNYNPNYSQTLLLRPVADSDELEGYYTVVENVAGAGGAITLENEVQEGDIALIVHSDKSDPSLNSALARLLVESLVAGQEVYVFGVSYDENGNLGWKYNNAQVCVVFDPATTLFGSWANDTEIITFNADRTGLRGETEFAWELSEDGELTIDGTKTEWSVDDTTLTLGEDTYTKVTEGDYTVLKALIAAAQLLKSDSYTEESYAAVTSALADATAVVEAEYTSLDQDKIDAAREALQAAIDALVDVKAPEPESSVEESSTASTATSSAASEDEGGLSGGMIALIVIIVVVVIAVIVVVVVLVSKKKKAK